MLLWFAHRAAIVARLLVLLLAAGTALPTAIHAGGADDPYCDPSRSSQGTDAWTPGSGIADREHCEICHWLRAVRSFDAVPTPSLDAPRRRDHALRPLLLARAVPERASAPTRAPPA